MVIFLFLLLFIKIAVRHKSIGGIAADCKSLSSYLPDWIIAIIHQEKRSVNEQPKARC